jgi:hypothetical protein
VPRRRRHLEQLVSLPRCALLARRHLAHATQPRPTRRQLRFSLRLPHRPARSRPSSRGHRAIVLSTAWSWPMDLLII